MGRDFFPRKILSEARTRLKQKSASDAVGVIKFIFAFQHQLSEIELDSKKTENNVTLKNEDLCRKSRKKRLHYNFFSV